MTVFALVFIPHEWHRDCKSIIVTDLIVLHASTIRPQLLRCFFKVVPTCFMELMLGTSLLYRKKREFEPLTELVTLLLCNENVNRQFQLYCSK